MRERPILFSSSMVLALLAGTKTQTRRIAKLPAVSSLRGDWAPTTIGGVGVTTSNGASVPETLAIGHFGTGAVVVCPYGQPGDRLWVRESFARGTQPDQFFYMASRLLGHANTLKWKPSIHMPRTASRITLEVTGVRVERVNDISQEDAIAEGIERTADGCWLRYTDDGPTCTGPRESYRSLWESINGAGSWAFNPWVWCIEFRRLP